MVLVPKVWKVADGDNMYTPMNMTGHPQCSVVQDEMGSCASTALLAEFLRYSQEHPWKLVRFPSRRGNADQQGVELTGWWLPAADPQAPRIVVGHGYRRNFDAHYVQLPAYLLRSIGFSVLIPSYRDHGLSQNSTRPFCTWGYAYPYDLLGAWDFAVNDPTGELGGAVPAGKVGLMGFSMGGFVASTAFGLEPQAPGLWLDAAAFDVRSALAGGVDSTLHTSGFGKLLAPLSVLMAKHIAGVDPSLNSPTSALQHATPGPVPRPVALLGNSIDALIQPSQPEAYRNILHSNPALYNFTLDHHPSYRCGTETHVNLYLWRPNDYRQKLCDFWSSVFHSDSADCGLARLPSFPQCAGDAVDCPVPPAA